MSDKNSPTTEQSGETLEFTLSWIMQKIDAIVRDTEHLTAAQEDVAMAREVTNQKLIELINRMYDDVKPHRMKFNAEQLIDLAEHLPPENLERVINTLT
jgi:hypothetical protein